MNYCIGATAVLLFVFSFFSGCVKKDTGSSNAVGSLKVIENVPFIKQKYRYCGPAALASVMNFYGMNLVQDDVARHIYTPELYGSLISDMNYYAVEKGFRAITENGSIENILTLIDEDRPVILLVDKGKLGLRIQHYYVAYGYNPEKKVFIINDGKERGKKIGYVKLDKEWEKMNRLMLVIYDEN